jgi:O-antigen/teichoic acid export membrane protein
MFNNGKMRGRASLTVGVAQVLVQLSSLTRYAIVARLIPPAEFGIAALVIGAAQLVELVSSAGTDTILIQAEDGDDPQLQSAVHMLRSLRGLLNGLLLFILAGPITSIFGLGQYQNELRLLALFPVIRGLFHTDFYRLQRHFRFSSWIAAETVPNLVTSIVVIVLAHRWLDHRAVVAGILIQSVLSLVLSHALAERPYRWKYSKPAFSRFASFSWPLALNALVVFAYAQGDRLLIGMGPSVFGNTTFTLQALGVYSATATLIMAPSFAVSNAILALGLPYFSAAQASEGEFISRFRRSIQWALLIAMCFLCPMLLYGPEMILAITDNKHDPSRMLVNGLALLWAIRILRTVVTVASLGLGDTKNGLISNCARLVGLAVACAAVGLGAAVEIIAAIGAGSELVATGISFHRLRQRVRHKAFQLAVPTITCSVLVCLVIYLGVAGVPPSSVAFITIVLGSIVVKVLTVVRQDVYKALVEPAS